MLDVCTSDKGKVNHAPQDSIGGCSSSSRPWARRWRTTNVCDTWPTVTFPATRYHRPLAGTIQTILLGDRGTHVLTTCPELHSTAQRLGFEPATYWSHLTATPPSHTSQTEIVTPTASTEHVPPCRVSRETRWSGWSFRVPSRRRVSCRCGETTSSAASWRLPAGSRAVFRRTPWCSSAAPQTSWSTVTNKHCVPVMWSDRRRPSVLGQKEQKNRSWFWSCTLWSWSWRYGVVKHGHHHIWFWYLRCCGCPGLRGRQDSGVGIVTVVVIMILKDKATFQVLLFIFSILCLEHHYLVALTVSATLFVICSFGLGFVILVLVL